MSDKIPHINIGHEVTPGTALKSHLDKMSDDVRREMIDYYRSPVKMRFEWEGRIYEGTAYYVKDVEKE